MNNQKKHSLVIFVVTQYTSEVLAVCHLMRLFIVTNGEENTLIDIKIYSFLALHRSILLIVPMPEEDYYQIIFGIRKYSLTWRISINLVFNDAMC